MFYATLNRVIQYHLFLPVERNVNNSFSTKLGVFCVFPRFLIHYDVCMVRTHIEILCAIFHIEINVTHMSVNTN